MLRFNTKGDFNLPVGNVDFNQNVVNALNAYFEYVTDKDIEKLIYEKMYHSNLALCVFSGSLCSDLTY